MPVTLRTLLATCLALAAPAAAHAQYQMMSPMLYEGPRISLQDHAARGAQAPRGAPGAAAVDASAFKFRPNLAQRRANLDRFVAKSREADAAAGESLAKVFAEGDIIERMRPGLSKFGLSVDSLADAYTVWWISAWQASRGVDDDPSPATAAAVRAQFMKAAASTPQFAGAGDSAKQEMSESLLIQAMLLTAAVEQAKANPAHMQTVRAGALQAGQGMGVDLAGMELTEAGFVPARGS